MLPPDSSVYLPSCANDSFMLFTNSSPVIGHGGHRDNDLLSLERASILFSLVLLALVVFKLGVACLKALQVARRRAHAPLSCARCSRIYQTFSNYKHDVKVNRRTAAQADIEQPERVPAVITSETRPLIIPENEGGSVPERGATEPGPITRRPKVEENVQMGLSPTKNIALRERQRESGRREIASKIRDAQLSMLPIDENIAHESGEQRNIDDGDHIDKSPCIEWRRPPTTPDPFPHLARFSRPSSQASASSQYFSASEYSDDEASSPRQRVTSQPGDRRIESSSRRSVQSLGVNHDLTSLDFLDEANDEPDCAPVSPRGQSRDHADEKHSDFGQVCPILVRHT